MSEELSSSPPSLRRFRDRDRYVAALDAVAAVDLNTRREWQKTARKIEAHAGKFTIEEIQATPEGTFESGDNGFAADATVYLRWDGLAAPAEELAAAVTGHFDTTGDRPVAVVDHVAVDPRAALE
ncbi:MAG: hypothetical protein ACP5NP_12400 [Acetobacteraceae bacterium]